MGPHSQKVSSWSSLGGLEVELWTYKVVQQKGGPTLKKVSSWSSFENVLKMEPPTTKNTAISLR